MPPCRFQSLRAAAENLEERPGGGFPRDRLVLAANPLSVLAARGGKWLLLSVEPGVDPRLKGRARGQRDVKDGRFVGGEIHHAPGEVVRKRDAVERAKPISPFLDINGRVSFQECQGLGKGRV